MVKDTEQGGDKKAPKSHGTGVSARLNEDLCEDYRGHKASIDWQSDQLRVCYPGGQAEYIPSIQSILDVLSASRTGTSLLSHAEKQGVEICYDRQTAGAQFHVSNLGKVILLNPHHSLGDLLGLLGCALRHAWQHAQGALVDPLSYEPEDAILVSRAQAADAYMMTVRIAWELKLAGEQDAWDWIIGSPIADVGRAFSALAQKDFRTLNNGQAARAAYDAYFENGRCKSTDKRLIQQMLIDENGYMHPELDTATRDIKLLSKELFEQLGLLPDGGNYLLDGKQRLPLDSFYKCVEDRSNANFLWFIKFERSFHEKEVKMLEDSVRLSAEVIDFAKWTLDHIQERK